MKSYKLLYSEALNIKWDSSKYEVHHIDADRSNNNLSNLVLLPKELHRNLHFYYNAVMADIKQSDILNIEIGFMPMFNEKYLHNLI